MLLAFLIISYEQSTGDYFCVVKSPMV